MDFRKAGVSGEEMAPPEPEEEIEAPPSPADLDFLFRDLGEEITLDLLTKTVRDHLSAIETSAADALTFAYTGSADAYLREHSHNTCRLALFLAWQAGLSRDLVLKAGLAALIHDAGMARIPRRITEKDDFLGDDDWEIIEEHPEMGARIAESLEGMDPEVPEIIRQHHEVSDGSGYPSGLDASGMHGLAKVLSLVDCYEALSEPRIRPSESSVVLSPLQSSDLPPDLTGEEIADATPHGAMEAVLARGKQRFDPDLVESFRSILGIYPVGSYVELTGGEIARVISVNKDADTRPVVEIVRVKGGWSPMRPVVSDLLRSKGNEVERGVARDTVQMTP
jgi:putative nucleotidyltransferase with HDIG domain